MKTLSLLATICATSPAMANIYPNALIDCSASSYTADGQVVKFGLRGNSYHDHSHPETNGRVVTRTLITDGQFFMVRGSALSDERKVVLETEIESVVEELDSTWQGFKAYRSGIQAEVRMPRLFTYADYGIRKGMFVVRYHDGTISQEIIGMCESTPQG